MRSRLRLFAAAAILLLTGAVRAQALEEIKPPFGLTWGERSVRLEQLLKNAKATVVEKRTVDGREAWHVEGLNQTGLKRTVFYFREGELCEVELQYQRDDWDEAKYNTYMTQVRQNLEKRFGPGQLIVRKNEPAGDVAQTVVGYKWAQGTAIIDLFYYSAQNGSNIFRTLSVHYRLD